MDPNNQLNIKTENVNVINANDAILDTKTELNKEITIRPGILDKTRLVSNILMLILLVGNIFFSIQYTEGIRQQQVAQTDKIGTNIQVARFVKLFVDVVLNTETGQTISYENRVKLENSVREIKDKDIMKQWDKFVVSTNAKDAQMNAVSLMKLLTNKLII
jgi:hypothetical protein